MNKNTQKFGLLILLLSIFSMQLFGLDSPLKIMADVGMSQANDSLIPILITWILISTAVVSGVMVKLMPLVIGALVSFIIAISPDLVESFSTFDWTAQ